MLQENIYKCYSILVDVDCDYEHCMIWSWLKNGIVGSQPWSNSINSQTMFAILAVALFQALMTVMSLS